MLGQLLKLITGERYELALIVKLDGAGLSSYSYDCIVPADVYRPDSSALFRFYYVDGDTLDKVEDDYLSDFVSDEKVSSGSVEFETSNSSWNGLEISSLVSRGDVPENNLTVGGPSG